MAAIKVTTHTEEETKKVGLALAKQLASGSIICLHGDLGAGKTTLVKGLAEGLGITQTITSPTFTLMNIYPTNQTEVKQLVHIDTYRLKSAIELIEIGVDDYLGQSGVAMLIEWPEKIAELLDNKKVTNVTIDHLEENARLITIE